MEGFYNYSGRTETGYIMEYKPIITLLSVDDFLDYLNENKIADKGEQVGNTIVFKIHGVVVCWVELGEEIKYKRL